jgi:hypothetical protein
MPIPTWNILRMFRPCILYPNSVVTCELKRHFLMKYFTCTGTTLSLILHFQLLCSLRSLTPVIGVGPFRLIKFLPPLSGLCLHSFHAIVLLFCVCVLSVRLQLNPLSPLSFIILCTPLLKVHSRLISFCLTFQLSFCAEGFFIFRTDPHRAPP